MLTGHDFVHKSRSYQIKSSQRNFSHYRKTTIGTIIAAIEANNDMYCLKKQIEKFSLRCYIFYLACNVLG